MNNEMPRNLTTQKKPTTFQKHTAHQNCFKKKSAKRLRYEKGKGTQTQTENKGYTVCSKQPQKKIYLEGEQEEKLKELKARLCQEMEEQTASQMKLKSWSDCRWQ